jgi:hypothetical protein
MASQQKRFSGRLVSIIVRNPWLTLTIALLAIGGLGTGLPRMTANFTHTAFFNGDDPDLVRFNAFERQFGNDDAVVVAVHSPSGVFDEETANLLRTLTERMWHVAEVIRVDSLANFQWVHAVGDEIEIEPLLPKEGPLSAELLAERKRITLKHELLPGYLVNDDATAALVYARIKPGLDAPPDAERIVRETREVIAALALGDHEFHLLGGPVINDAFRESASRDMSLLVPALLLMVVLLLIATFRRVGGVVLPFVVILCTVSSALALSGWLGIEMSSVTMILPQVLIAVCVADAVHVLTGFYRARNSGQSRRDAATYTLNKNFVPTLLTSVTTAAGFFSFATANLPPIAGFGVLAGLGTLIAWAVSYAVVGPLMVLWPGREPASAGETVEHTLHVSGPRSRRFMGIIARHRGALVAGFSALTLVAVALGSRNTVNSNPYEYFARGVPVRDAQDFALEKLSGIANFEIVVDSGREDGVKDPEFLRKVSAFETGMLDIPGVTRTVSLVDILRQMNRALSGGADEDYKLPDSLEGVAQELLLYTMGLPQGMDVNDRITVKNDALRITVISTIIDSNEAVRVARLLESNAAGLGLDAHVTGKSLLYQSMNGRVVQSFLQSLLLAVFFIGAIILVAFRSLSLGLLSAIPNGVPLLIGAGVLYLVSGTVDIGTVMVSSVCLGIAVDNTIHILTHYRQHQVEGASGRQSFEQLLTHTGPAMIATTIILVLGFSTLAFGTFVPNVYFGLLTAVILGFGLVADIVLLPAVLLLLERRAKATPAGAKPVLEVS